MSDEEIHNIYLHMCGKAEGIAEATGSADFPVLFARAILKYSKREWVNLTSDEALGLVEKHKRNTLTMLAEAQYMLKEKNT